MAICAQLLAFCVTCWRTSSCTGLLVQSIQQRWAFYTHKQGSNKTSPILHTTNPSGRGICADRHSSTLVNLSPPHPTTHVLTHVLKLFFALYPSHTAGLTSVNIWKLDSYLLPERCLYRIIHQTIQTTQHMKATIVFNTQDKPRGWKVTKCFSDSRHMKNYIKCVERKGEFTYDEHYIHPTT